MKERLDKVIKQRRLIRSRSRAQRMIEAGRIKVNGLIVNRPGHPIDTDAEIEVLGYEPYVSRGGEKLEAALEQFRVDPKGRVCLDVGASTGGFTDCLLQHGAAKVYAIDVGHDQLHPTLRSDPRVVVREGLNARYLESKDIADPIDLIVVDVSFISLKLILPPLVEILARGGELVLLVKPQFEVGKDALPPTGVVKDAALQARVLNDVSRFIESDTPWHVVEDMLSPIEGEKGNTEFLVHVR
ncbi:MAG: TlyA family RNA methyltransferase [Candidatus Bipolaricaulota bacterium]|nr:TlyA family RNA methyltransferase [Candidatus Bipolaricaulota bacterium]